MSDVTLVVSDKFQRAKALSDKLELDTIPSNVNNLTGYRANLIIVEKSFRPTGEQLTRMQKRLLEGAIIVYE